VYSNCDDVDLFLNNRSLGAKKIKRAESLHAEWDVPYKPGELKAVARKDGQVVATQIIRTANEAARLELGADRTEIAADGRDLSFIEVKLTDDDGTLCPDSDRMVQVKVEGDGVLLGVGNGSALNHEPFTGSQVRTFYGLCRVIVKSTRTDGAIKVTVSADGVDAAQVEINTLPADDPRLQKERAEKTARILAESNTYSRHRITAHHHVQVAKPVRNTRARASSQQAGHPPEHAIDGNPETRWCPEDGNSGHVWQVDLGAPHDVTGAHIHWQVASLYQYKVEGSADGNHWVMLSDQSGRTATERLHKLLFDRTGIRHVRVVTTGLPKGLWGSFYEVEVMGERSADQQSSGGRNDAAKCVVAPVFKHGSGQHTDSVIVSRNQKPPTWSEADARTVVVDEARRLGLELTYSGAVPMGLDGISRDGKIAFEVLTSEDVSARTDNTDHITDFYGAAQKRVKELGARPGGLMIGVFYDPLVGNSGKPDDELLRKQVRDFVRWLEQGTGKG
jgi:hypothetical protein